MITVLVDKGNYFDNRLLVSVIFLSKSSLVEALNVNICSFSEPPMIVK